MLFLYILPMKYVGLVIIALLAAVAVLLPTPDEPQPGPEVGIEKLPVAICPVEEGRGRSTDVAILSDVDGPTQLTLFAEGEIVGSLGTTTGPSGSTVVPVGDVVALGTMGGLIELPTAGSTAGVVVSGAQSFIAELCPSASATQVLLTGGSTAGGDTFEMQLMNPYAGEAIVSFQVTSEVGLESNDRFSSIVVPPRSSRIIDFNQLVPGRENLSVLVETTLGSVVSVARRGVEGESALWTAIEPAQDWFLPVPRGGASKELILSTSSATEVDYQVDFYGPDGLVEAFLSDVLSARGSITIDLAAISEEPAAVRVIATGPVVPTLLMAGERTLAMTTAARAEASRWMLPGAGTPDGGFANLVILNAGLGDSTVRIRPLRENTSVRSLVVEADDVVEVGIQPADGYLVEATSPVVVLWIAFTNSGAAAAIGVPLPDG